MTEWTPDPAAWGAAVSYGDFLAAKAQKNTGRGFEPDRLPAHLFDFQRELTDWAVRQGRGAVFADCGMGKTPMELAWAEQVHRHTGKPVLLLTPLAVGFQIVAEADKFGHDAALSRNGKTAAPITVTNYEQAHKFDPAQFGGVVCDESSAIKAFDGTTRAVVTELMREMPYRLLGTATAAPNDYLELGTSSEALGELGYMDMLSRFFVNDARTSTHRLMASQRGGNELGGAYRFKGHAEQPFWRWVSSWARAIRKPSDYGYSDDGFHLPPLHEVLHVVESSTARDDQLFDTVAIGLAEERAELRRSLPDRCEKAAELLSHSDLGVAWCQLNDESAMLARLIDGAVEVSGSDSPDAKEEKLRAFTAGEIRVLVTKPSIGAWGLNWQHAHHMTYFPSHSYEQLYQAERRMWRFGQSEPVTVDVVASKGIANVLASLQRKSKQADRMFDALLHHMTDALRIERHTDHTARIEVPAWLAS